MVGSLGWHERTVELISVTKRFGTTAAVDWVNLKIPGGAYCCRLGPSGCGKTTTLRRRTAMMFQSYALFPHLTALDDFVVTVAGQQLGRSPVKIGDAVAAVWAEGDARLLQAA